MTDTTILFVDNATFVGTNPADRLRAEGFRVHACPNSNEAMATLLSRNGVEHVADLRTAVHSFERQYIQRVLTLTNGSKVEAARKLGIGLSSLYRKIDELNIGRGTPAIAPTSQYKSL